MISTMVYKYYKLYYIINYNYIINIIGRKYFHI